MFLTQMRRNHFLLSSPRTASSFSRGRGEGFSPTSARDASWSASSLSLAGEESFSPTSRIAWNASWSRPSASPSQTTTRFAFEYISVMDRTWCPRSSMSPWLMQTASTHITRPKKSSRSLSSASWRFSVMGKRRPSMEIHFVVSDIELGFSDWYQQYDKASYRQALLSMLWRG